MKDMVTIPQTFFETSQKFPENPALIYKKGHLFELVPYKRLLNLVENFTLSLEKLGIKKGDRVALVSENRPEWPVVDLSVESLGAIIVPIHKVLSAEQIKLITFEVEPSLFIVSDKESFLKILEIKKNFKKDIPLVYLNPDIKKEEVFKELSSYSFVEALKFLPHQDYAQEFLRTVKNLKPQDTATILYTSGTTGKLKGVELTHNNILSNVKDTLKIVKVRPEDKFLSILPLSHIFERTVGYYVPLFSGSAISYLDDPTHLSEIAREQKPSIIIAVPRLYEKVYEKIKEKARRSRLKKTLFNLALSYGKNSKNRGNLGYKIFDHLVYKKVKEVFGGNIRFFVSGGASLNPEIGQFFDCLGLPVLEGYGLTETSPIITCNRLENYCYGTVGPPLPSTQVKIASDGEILVKGPGVAQGYFKNGEANREAFVDGWFKTGDLGKINGNGFLKIVGRKKEIVVLSTGQNISPVPIEEQLELSKYIHQAMVFGNGQKHISALIVPEFESLKKVFGEKSEEKLIKDEKVKEFIQREIDRELKDFAPYEQIKKFILLVEPFTVENELLTPTLKLRRQPILKKYHKEIEKLYSS